MSKNTFGKKTSLLIGLIAFLGLGARAATWTGAGEDNLWSNPANWGGTAPGASDTAVFDGTSSKNCTVDVEKVLNLTIDAAYAGTITLGNAFTVLKKHAQNGGTFTCGDHDYTVGASASGKDGQFELLGGTFNAPSGNFLWLPQRQWNDGYVKIDGGKYNANGGTFIAAMVATVGGQHNGSDFFVYNTEFHNLTVRTLRQAARLSCKMTNDVIRGDFRHEGGQIVDAVSRERGSNTNNWVRNVRLEGDLYVGSLAYGGSLAIAFETPAEQTIHFVRDGATTVPRCCGLVVDKPNGAKVKVVSDDGCARFGYGSDDRNPYSDNYSYNCFSGIWVERGVLDFSAVDTVYALFDNGTGFQCYKSEGTNILWPQETVLNTRLSQNLNLKNHNFQSLTLVSSQNPFVFPKNSTNAVSGALTLRSSSVGCATSVQMNDKPATWTTSGRPVATLAVLGDVRLENPRAWKYMGGTGNVLLCGTEDQTISVTNNAAMCTLILNKPSGKVKVDSLDGSPLALAANSDTANGGHLIMEQGEIEFPSEGVSFTNCHFSAFVQFGGTFTYKDGCTFRFGHRNGTNYSIYLGVQQALPSILVTRGSTLNPMTDLPIRLGGDITVEANFIAGTSIIEGSADQRFLSKTGAVVFKNASGSLGGARIAKTGGRLICDSQFMTRDLTIDDGSTLDVDCPASFEGAVFRVERNLVFPKDGTVGLALGDVPGDVDDLSRDLISYVGTISNYRADGWTFDLGANFSRPKVTHDASAKLISFSCRRRRGLKLLVR